MYNRAKKFRVKASLSTLLFAASLVAGCASTDEVPLEPVDQSGHAIDVQRYDLRGEFDWDRGRLIATVDITARVPGHAQTTISLDSAVDVKAVRLAGGGALGYVEDAERDRIEIHLPAEESRGSGGGAPTRAGSDEIVLQIDYEAGTSESLMAVPARVGDPTPGHAVFTASEPIGVAQWMPCNNVPTDRAMFSVDMRVPEGEALIANGALVIDASEETSGRRMSYETTYTLPTYLMAFAIGEFEVETAMKGDLPVSVWHRPGLPGDYDRLLQELSRLIDQLEGLLGPYPFEKYSLVLLPGFLGSGIEHASISFQSEAESTQPAIYSDLVLSAHELAHQWFGDLVTIETWDDLWIKEGMATLLQQEGARVYMDESGVVTLNGDAFSPEEGEAIRDTSRPPLDKYGAGPYDRGAWLLTQIRSLVGEQAFWETLRGVLERHRFGSIGTDAFLDAFAPALGADTLARARRAVDARALPRLIVEPAAPGGTRVTIADPEGAMIAPMELAWLAEDGTRRIEALQAGKPLELPTNEQADLLIVDPRDVHPDWGVFPIQGGSGDDSSAALEALAALRVPRGPRQISQFLEIGGMHELAALAVGLPAMAPEELGSFLDGLDGDPARLMAVRAACRAAGATEADSAERQAWALALSELVAGITYSFGLEIAEDYAACSEVVDPEELLQRDWAALARGDQVSEVRLAMLSMFAVSDEAAFSIWTEVARGWPSVRGRRLAAATLRMYAAYVAPEDVARWHDFFVELLQSTDVFELLDEAISGVVETMAPTAAENAEALTGLRRVLAVASAWPIHELAACAALKLANGDEQAWARFSSGLDGVGLSPYAAAVLQDPSACAGYDR